MTILSCENISLSFGVKTVLDKISFSINEGDKLGIVGVNGAGKTSLLNIICGDYRPTEGNIHISKDIKIGLFRQNSTFDKDCTILDGMLEIFSDLIEYEKKLEVLHASAESGGESDSASYASALDEFTSMGGYEFRGRCRGTLKSLGFDEESFDRNVHTLSGGQKTRLSLASVLLSSPDILVLDEPTNHLDIESLLWLENFLKLYRKTVIVISHDRYFLDRVTNKTLEIENKKGKLYNCAYTEYLRQKAELREAQLKKYTLQQKEVKRVEGIIEQQRRWGQEHNFITIKAKEKYIEHMDLVDRPEDAPRGIDFAFINAPQSGNDVIDIRKLCKSFGSRNLIENLSCLIKRGEHLFIIGENGCGKSTLLKMIAGSEHPSSGVVEYGYNVRVGYYDQENQRLNENNTVLDELWNEYPSMNQTSIRKALAHFRFIGDDIEKKVSVLSGGEKARLTLAKLIMSPVNLLILDEPTNHLDISSREALEDALAEFEGTIIAVSHDRYFINKLSNRIMDFSHGFGEVPFVYNGGYESYMEYKKRFADSTSGKDGAETRSVGKQSYLENKKSQSEKRKVKRRIELLVEESAKMEDELKKTEAALMDEEHASDYELIASLYNKKEELEEKLLEMYSELEELERIEN